MEPADTELAESKLASRPEDVEKGDLMARLRELLKGYAISWLMAGERFDWGEINPGKERFIGGVRRTDFGSARMSVHVPGKGSAYSSYRTTG